MGTGLPGLNQYKARINVSFSRTQHSDAGEAQTRAPSVLSQAPFQILLRMGQLVASLKLVLTVLVCDSVLRPWKGVPVSHIPLIIVKNIPYPIPKIDMASIPEIQKALYPHIPKIDPSIQYPFKYLQKYPVSL